MSIFFRTKNTENKPRVIEKDFIEKSNINKKLLQPCELKLNTKFSWYKTIKNDIIPSDRKKPINILKAVFIIVYNSLYPNKRLC